MVKKNIKYLETGLHDYYIIHFYLICRIFSTLQRIFDATQQLDTVEWLSTFDSKLPFSLLILVMHFFAVP